MNVLVTGANGQLGRELQLVTAGSSDNYFFTDVDELDITDKSAIDDFVKNNGINVIVNCAAFTNVDAAEDNLSAANLLNNTAVEYLSDVAVLYGATLIHISTDYVFGDDGVNVPYTEDAETHPVSVYGKTKLDGETAVVNSGCNYIIIRTSWLYSEFGKNFLLTMLNLTSTKPAVNVVFDQIGTPTYAYDLASAIYHIVEKRMYNKQGIYNYSNEGVCSWFDFAKFIATVSGNSDCSVLPCHSSEIPSKVKRPNYSVLDKTKFKNTFGLSIPHWYDSLEVCLSKLK